MTPGEKFARERRALGLTQYTLGAVLGVTDRQVRTWEASDAPRHAWAYMRALKALGPAARMTLDF